MRETMKRPDRGDARFGANGAASKTRKPRSFNTTSKVDFEAINAAAIQSLPFLLARWLPGGKRIGKEYVALNPTRNDRHAGSFKVVIVGNRAGLWADFATGDSGGDPISLAAYLFCMRQGEAARKLAEMLGVMCHD
jgi:hypothetical protein